MVRLFVVLSGRSVVVSGRFTQTVERSTYVLPSLRSDQCEREIFAE